MLRDFGCFLRAFWGEWKALLTGGSVVAVLVLVQSATGKTLPPIYNWILVAVTLLLAGFLSWRKQWIRAGQDFLDAKPADLISTYSGRTSITAESMVRLHLGRRIRINGNVLNVHSQWPWLLVFLEDVDGISVMLTISVWRGHLFRVAPKGTGVTVSGRISNISPSEVRLSSVAIETVENMSTDVVE